MRSVACFGALHADIKGRLLEPLRRGTSNPVTTTRTVGGVACNVARTLALLGVPVRLVSLVGPGADPLLEVVAGDGVDVSEVAVLSGETTASYLALLGPDGALEAGVADMEIYRLMDAEWGLGMAPWGDIWFADANIPAGGLAALGSAAAGRPLFLDPVSVAKADRIAPALALAEGVFPDEAEATALTGRADATEAAVDLVAAGVVHAIVTMGERGVVHAGPEGVEARAAVEPDRVADVTGAGDAFAAGYLGGLALDADDPVGWGMAAASLAVETLETVPSDLGLERLLARVADS